MGLIRSSKELEKIKSLMGKLNPINEGIERSKVEFTKTGADGNVYGIVRESSNYFIKTTPNKENITESDFNYIGGLQNIKEYKFPSYEKALRTLNLVFEGINETYGIKGGINLFENDSLTEKKYVLKTKTSAPAPAPEPAAEPIAEPTTDEPSFDFGDDEGGDEPSFDFGDEEGGDDTFDFGDDETTDDTFDFGDDGDDESDDGDDDPIKDIQRLTGKLGQKLRDTEDVSSDMEKWVAKSVMSAIDMASMEKSDRKDIIKSIKSSGDDVGDVGGDDFGGLGDDMDLNEYDDVVEEPELIYNSDDSSVFSEDDLDELYRLENMDDEEESDGGHEWNISSTNPNDVDTMSKLNQREFDRGNDDYPMGDHGMSDPLDARGMRHADKDIRSHYHKSAFPHNDYKPSETWGKHTLPYDTFDDSENNDYLNGEETIYEIELEDMAEPATKPGIKEPAVKPPSRRQRPFTRPPHIKPGEESRPKAGLGNEVDDDYHFPVDFE